MSRPLLRALFALCLAPVCWLAWAAALQPLPAALEREAPASVRVLDRNGRVIGSVRTEQGLLAERVALSDVSPVVIDALLAAEDARFWWHPGIDPLAIVRAGVQLIVNGRVVSGASTLTQQLARNLEPRPRTLAGKFRELAIAIRIEASLDKRRILAEYLNRIEFGPNLVGIEAASRHYFDKPAARLSLGEAATLVSIPRGPTLYDPARGTERVARRRARVLERMRERGLAQPEEIERALSEPVRLERGFVEGGAPHLTRAVAAGVLEPELTAGARQIVLGIDLELQREVETLARRQVDALEAHDATSAAVLVVDNASGEVLSYVGSPDFFSQPALGQNDGARALRQPGSTLKPFVYAAAIEELGMTAATLLPDVELHLPTPQGAYAPKNYDGRFHGPVRLREALASSLNVPAVHTAARVGPGRVLELLQRSGFESLSRDAAHYGAAIALGDGEVKLSELASAYATLANGGVRRRLHFVKSARHPDGRVQRPKQPRGERVIGAELAALLTDVLADPAARAAAFGRGGVLELPFPAAVKTGTSKGFRDNWSVGFTRELTVAVWVGNFDGRPMRDSSGVTGAGPLFRDVMLAAMRGRSPAPLADRSGLVHAEICSLSGKRPAEHCSHRTRELFTPESVPRASCDLHVEISIDPENGLRAGSGCPNAERRVFEAYPASYRAWAARAGRPLPPSGDSPRCPGSRAAGSARPSVAFPFDGARFVIDPGLPRAQQQLVLRAHGAAGDVLRFVLDGRPLAHVGPPYSVAWPLSPGDHVLLVEAAGVRSESVRFSVR